MIFCLELPALQRPQISYFLNDLDARLFASQWNRLEEDALVFDPSPSRAPTVLGRFTNSNLTWYQSRPAWKDLLTNPTPEAVFAEGYAYAYLGDDNLARFGPELRASWSKACLRIVAEATQGANWRRLYDLRNCRE